MKKQISSMEDLEGMGEAASVNLASLEKAKGDESILLCAEDAPNAQVTEILDSVSSWVVQKDPAVQFGLPVPVTPEMDVQQLASCLSGWAEQGLAFIDWQMGSSGGGLPRELLWKVSKQGVWNHVSGSGLFGEKMGDRAWIVNNPNIVHSFEDIDAQDTNASVTPPKGLFTYENLTPVPGDALWKVVQKPAKLLALLSIYSKKDLLRMRVDKDKGNIWKTGTRIEYFFERPEMLSSSNMDDIVAMVDAGGSVDITHVRDNLQKAYLVAYAMENGVIVGNSSLKHPRDVFIERLKTITGIDFSRCVERGYTSVRPEYRAMGIGARLLEGLTARATDVKIFSIISEDNLATQKIAIRNRTRKITTYFSDKLGKKMGVWMPEHMIDDDKGSDQ